MLYNNQTAYFEKLQRDPSEHPEYRPYADDDSWEPYQDNERLSRPRNDTGQELLAGVTGEDIVEGFRRSLGRYDYDRWKTVHPTVNRAGWVDARYRLRVSGGWTCYGRKNLIPPTFYGGKEFRYFSLHESIFQCVQITFS